MRIYSISKAILSNEQFNFLSLLFWPWEWCWLGRGGLTERWVEPQTGGYRLQGLVSLWWSVVPKGQRKEWSRSLGR